MELAIYLKQLFQVAGLHDVIRSSLRANNKFNSALLQLAWAYRFRKLGAEIQLEPPAASGQGDILITWRNKKYTVECYIEKEASSLEEVKDVIHTGEVIENYPSDKPYPSCLILGYVRKNVPLYVLCALGEFVHIITVHWLDPTKWLDPKTRREKRT